ncbi:hypothetical protein G5V57_23420 [Nordella sp. HKS 07]|uniref:hypothetical protein n=1 Tax=Nordella sp. HKS 07 TaxID=2712222 RepID=UPI0013E1BC04|nr:hypothetical protein [Nordella sp. HKS 07]QIG50420.1 hypothetical protein G5V57_23420 [Nordella sp. HKS 07]
MKKLTTDPTPKADFADALHSTPTASIEEPKCPFSAAVYTDRSSDYELRIISRDGAVTEMGVDLTSKSTKLNLRGEIMWSNGAARPYIALAALGDTEEFYGGEIYALAVEGAEVINSGLPGPDDDAPPTLLLPNYSATFYSTFRDDYPETAELPQDVYYLTMCQK